MRLTSLHPVNLLLVLALVAGAVPVRAEDPVRTVENGVSLPLAPWVGGPEFRITDHGAKPGTEDDAAPAVQAAIEAAARAGGGRVIVPRGEFLCGPVTLRSRIRLTLEEGATLKVLPPSRYPGGLNAGSDFIFGREVQDVVIDGAGTIEGQGSEWWSHWKEEGVNRPRLIALRKSARVQVTGITMVNAPMFNIAMSGMQDVRVNRVTVLAPPSEGAGTISHNTDACDVSGRYILVEDSVMDVGDDNFTCAGGTSDVMIRNNRYGSGHGVSIGSPTKGGIARYVVKNCTFTGTTCGIRIKSDRDRGGLIEDITYQDLTMDRVRYPILVYGAYAATGKFRDLSRLDAKLAATYPPAPVTATTPRFRNITFARITAKALPTGRCALVWGLPEMPVEGLVLRDLNITGPRGLGLFHARDVVLERCTFQVPDGQAAIDRLDAPPLGSPAAEGP